MIPQFEYPDWGTAPPSPNKFAIVAAAILSMLLFLAVVGFS